MKFERVYCPICGKECDETVFDMETKQGRVYVSICENDGMVFLNPRWTEEKYKEYYQEEYHKTHHKVADRVKMARACINRSHICKRPKVLDIGAGHGWLIDAFKSLSMEVDMVDAIEPDTSCMADLSRKGYNHLSANINDSWWLRERKYDFVVMRHVLEHLLRPVDVLQKVSLVLSDEGVVYIALPDMLIPNTNRTPHTYFEPAHVYYFNSKTLAMITAKAGLVPVRIDSIRSELFGVFRRGKVKQEDAYSIYEEQLKVLEEFKEKSIIAQDRRR